MGRTPCRERPAVARADQGRHRPDAAAGQVDAGEIQLENLALGVAALELDREALLGGGAGRDVEADDGEALKVRADGAALVGSVQVRNLATIGGNLCNAAPSADMAPPLLALEAEAVIAGPRGERRVPIASFFTGVRRTVLGPDELLVELFVPDPGAGSGGTYVRHTPRRRSAFAAITMRTTSGGGLSRKATSARKTLMFEISLAFSFSSAFSSSFASRTETSAL